MKFSFDIFVLKYFYFKKINLKASIIKKIAKIKLGHLFIYKTIYSCNKKERIILNLIENYKRENLINK